jgi:hypothetical protein
MNDIRNILQDADPLRHEPPPSEGERDRIRHMAVAAASHATTSASSAWFRTPTALVAAIALIIVVLVAFGSQNWPPGGATVQAAVRFEVRLAEDQSAAGLREARVIGSGRAIYLHEEIVVTNADIESSAVVPGSSPSQFGIGVRFTAEGARKMREATAKHVGRPVAILIDGEVVMAPTLRDPISADALISGDYSRAEAERIVNGITIR